MFENFKKSVKIRSMLPNLRLQSKGLELKCVSSNLAIDLDNYDEVVQKRVEAGELEQDTAALLKHFHQEGYCRFHLEDSEATIDQMVADVEELWHLAPDDLLGASQLLSGGSLLPLSELRLRGENDNHRCSGSRITDVQSHSDAARALYLHPKIHGIIDQILETKCIATQSLFFEYGSSQSLHRDPWFVVTRPVQNLIACWIALEDITEDAGPLVYVPRSHRLPFLHDARGNFLLHAPHVTPEFKQDSYGVMRELVAKNKLEPKEFLAKKGEVLIWHGGLVHGGAKVSNPDKTRKSFVVHFDAESTKRKKSVRYVRKGEEIVKYSLDVYNSGGSLGYMNPLKSK